MSTTDKILKILQAFLDRKEPVSIAELSNATGINISILYRVISPLRKEGYICKIPKSNQYIIGPKFLEFSNLARGTLSIDRVASPYLEKLNSHIDESVQLATLHGGVAVTTLMLHSKQKLRIVLGEKTELPLYCTGVGKIFLAHMKESELDKYLTAQQKREQYTANTNIKSSEIKKGLSEIKKNGVAIDQEEFVPGIVEIAAPIKNSNNQLVAAVGIEIPSSRATKDRVSELVALLKKTASEISTLIG